ncbi:hypothetical protein [Staphylococcus shinii]
MTQNTLTTETSILISNNDILLYVNDIVKTIPKSKLEEFKHHQRNVI